MRVLLAGLVAFAVAVAIELAGLAAEGRDAAAWSLACHRRAELPCGPGVRVGDEHYYALWTHCGVGAAVFDGRLWMAVANDRHPVPADVTEGRMRLLSRDRAEFRAGSLVAEFGLTTLAAVPPCY